MEQDTLELTLGNVKTISLPNRGSSGLRIIFSVDNPEVIEVTQNELKSMADLDSLKLKPGDPFPAFFTVKALAKGQTIIHFSERPPGSDTSRDMPMRKYLVTVKE